ncbi:hypothetical protein CORC01_11730 [Colletotrichum orchidophilum]|uniref:Uncharacterized protein n=1 Tax=Colletotrichum orchidophilum TaxID=1209926 RepID=A0A1G4AV14_9PEZI|nr:uncharacterized protein CORC01_11730 [Colletotrichum orchidophilum]OHE93007.1 hypothetical protein CORC01_11730 [Colletotrichum orchidophilum]
MTDSKPEMKNAADPHVKKEQLKEKGLQPANTKAKGSKIADPAGKVAGTAVSQHHEKPSRVLKPRPQHASSLETADDDEYDDCWDPHYEDPPTKNDKVVDEGFVLMKKPGSSR